MQSNELSLHFGNKQNEMMGFLSCSYLGHGILLPYYSSESILKIMKFTQYLIKNLIPEWIKLYINFKYLKTHLGVATKLKKLLRKAKKRKPKDVYQQLKYEVVSNKNLMKKLE
jgi:hypothetical protein